MTRRIFAMMPSGWSWFVTDDWTNAENEPFTDRRYWHGPYKTRDEARRAVEALKFAN